MDKSTKSLLDQIPTAEQKRKFYLQYAVIGFTILFALVFLNWLFHTRFFIETDNAYVNGNIVQVAPQISGAINNIYADITDYVSEGQVLFTIEQNDTNVRLARARANLVKAIREVQQLMSMVQQNRAIVELRKAELTNANSIFNRRTSLWKSRNVSQEAWQDSKTAREIAEAQYHKSLHDLESSMALMNNSTPFNHPLVEAAKSDFKTAYLDHERTVIVSPVNGYVAKRNAQVGSIVVPGMLMYAIVPLTEIWVDANFKETQLARLRIGQPVELIADKNKHRYQGKIAGFYSGTGSVFALLPAQNASGNWIKISQRLPVRINLVDKQEIQNAPLEIGLSMEAIVDTHNLDLPKLGKKNKITSPRYSTTIHQHQLEKADLEILAIYKEQTKPASTSNAMTERKTYA